LLLALEQQPIRLLASCVMPNHGQLVLWPKDDGELTAFVPCLMQTHTLRKHARDYRSGTGHFDQGHFKSFPIEADDHLDTVLRYVERNALRANLV